MNSGSDSNDKLWHSFKNGDRCAFERIYREHVRALLNYGYKVTNDRSIIEDSIQDLFFELWQSRDNISDTTSIKFYLFRALRYKICRNKKYQLSEFEELGIEHESFDSYSSHEDLVIGMEVQSFQMTHLKNCITQLPQRQQEAVNLRFYNGFSNEEVARIMGVNYQSACKFIYSALRKLKLNLKVSVSMLSLFLIFS